MNVNVINNTNNADVTVTLDQNSDGSFVITLNEKKNKLLKDCELGSIVKIGNQEFIVLEHYCDTTSVITKKFVKNMLFGESGDYTKSFVREYCNGEFYKELVKAVGMDNIVPHAVDLMADDGTGKGKVVWDWVSILTTDLYRRYHAYLPSYGDVWWTATRVSDDDSLGYVHEVCIVNSRGILSWHDGGYSRGVRPFCILNSSVLVS